MSSNRKVLRIAIATLALTATAAGCDWKVIDGVGGGPDAGSTSACAQGGAEQVSGGAGGAEMVATGGSGGAVQAPSGSRAGCGGSGGVGGQGGYSAE